MKKKLILKFLAVCFVQFFTLPLFCQTYKATIDSLALASIAESKIPGAVICVVEGEQITFLESYGYLQCFPDTIPMTINAQFDLASLSKVVGTGMSIMSLVDRNKIQLDDPIQKYLPEYDVPSSLIDFLTHTSGLPAYASYRMLLNGKQCVHSRKRKRLLFNYLAHCPRVPLPAFHNDSAIMRYSCLNFITLQYVVERVSGMTLDKYAEKYVFRSLDMKQTCYYPLKFNKGRLDRKTSPLCIPIAPTERIQDSDSCYIAIVHDPLAREMQSGVSGNAGVFSTAEDLAKLAIWVMNPSGNKGPFSGVVLKQMLSIPAGYEQYGRALSWDVSSDYSWIKGCCASNSAVCHTGYTGTSIVIDPEKQKAVIILTNRAHPNDKGSTTDLRKGVANAVFGAE